MPQGVGRALLPEFVAQAAASLPNHTWRAICQHVSRHTSGPITIRVGTACSGSEFYLTALPHLEEELSKRLHRRIRFDHRWSCELDPQKRQWFVDNFAPQKLFADLTQLAAGPCHDYLSGTLAEVDVVDIFIAGTSCKDASRLNPQHAQRLNVVEKAAHTTGGTFHGFARLVAKFGKQCRMVYLENVVSLQDRDRRTGRSNYDGVADVVRSLGFGFVSATFLLGTWVCPSRGLGSTWLEYGARMRPWLSGAPTRPSRASAATPAPFLWTHFSWAKTTPCL